MLDHGIRYPTIYAKTEILSKELELRKRLGFPLDKIYLIQSHSFENRKNDSAIIHVKNNVCDILKAISGFPNAQLYIYGEDEATGMELIKQRKTWKEIRKLGVKIFVAVSKDAVDLVGDLLDLAVLAGDLNPNQAELYHAMGQQIFSYHNPQIGQENPEIYRRNYGFALWKAGYDGAMNYAYFKSYGNVWNDFDDPRQRFRDETFVYPTSKGLISTIQWEGFREGIDDVRYLSTLLNRVDYLKNENKDVSKFEEWISRIDPNGNLDSLRGEIIQLILKTYKQ